MISKFIVGISYIESYDIMIILFGVKLSIKDSEGFNMYSGKNGIHLLYCPYAHKKIFLFDFISTKIIANTNFELGKNNTKKRTEFPFVDFT